MIRYEISFAILGAAFWLFFAYCDANLWWPVDSLQWGINDLPGSGFLGRLFVAIVACGGGGISFYMGAAYGSQFKENPYD